MPARYVFSSRPSLPLPAPHPHSSPSSSRSSSFLNSLPRSGACESWALAAMAVMARFFVLHVRVRRRASVLCSSPRLAASPPHAGEDREVAGRGLRRRRSRGVRPGVNRGVRPVRSLFFSGRARRGMKGVLERRERGREQFFYFLSRGAWCLAGLHARTRARRALPRNHAHGALRTPPEPRLVHLV